LTTDDGNNFDRIIVNPKINAVSSEHASAVAFANVINGWIEQWIVSDLLKSVYDPVEIGVRLCFPMHPNSPLVDADQVGIGLRGKSIAPHCGAILPWKPRGFVRASLRIGRFAPRRSAARAQARFRALV